jgi:hypothetical protein
MFGSVTKSRRHEEIETAEREDGEADEETVRDHTPRTAKPTRAGNESTGLTTPIKENWESWRVATEFVESMSKTRRDLGVERILISMSRPENKVTETPLG